jgi:nucleoporin POM34
MSRPATPQEEAEYVTPPRYSRSATPRSSFGSAGSFADSLRVQARGSPLSGRGSPFDAGSSVNSPFGSTRRASGSGSPFSASPLKDKMFSTSELGRRGSLGSSRGSPMGGDFDAISSPAKSGRASVGLNSKWLYQKGRASPSLAVGNGWGTGSVFN